MDSPALPQIQGLWEVLLSALFSGNPAFICPMVGLLVSRTAETILAYRPTCTIRLLTPSAVPAASISIPHFIVTPKSAGCQLPATSKVTHNRKELSSE